MTHPIWPGGPDCTCGQEPWSQYHEGWADARARLFEIVRLMPRTGRWHVAGMDHGDEVCPPEHWREDVSRPAVLRLIERDA